MKKNIIFDSVEKDLIRGDYPRRENGNYVFTEGQRSILEVYEPLVKELKCNYLKIEQEAEEQNVQIVALSESYDVFDEEYQELQESESLEKNKIEGQIQIAKNEKDAYLTTLRNEGFADLCNDAINEIEQSVNPEKKLFFVEKIKRNIKVIAKILGITMLLEGAILLILFSFMREFLSVEEIAIRTTLIMLSILLAHLVAEEYKKYKTKAKKAFLFISYAVLALMVVIPIVLVEHDKRMPDDISIEQSSYSLTDSSQESAIKNNNKEKTNSFFDLTVIRRSETLSVIVVFYFIGLLVFGKIYNESKTTPKLEPDDLRRKEKIKDLYFTVEKLEANLVFVQKKYKKEMTRNELEISKISTDLQKVTNSINSQESRKNDLKEKLNNIYEKANNSLHSYQRKYENLLNQKQVESIFIDLVWPSKADLETYFRADNI